MKIAIVGRDIGKIKYSAIHLGGYEIDYDNPEVVISNGGDGALLGAERDYPGIPKLGLRDSKTSSKHEHSNIDDSLYKLFYGQYTKKEFIKIETEFKGKKLISLNDISLRSRNLLSAIRYKVEINDKEYIGEIIGDGLIVSTPVGSSAYYRSITHSLFRVGIGLAFNNSTEPISHLVLEEDSIIKAKVLRGPAFVASDNNEEMFELNDNDEIIIKKHHQKATLLFTEEREGELAFTRLV